MSARQKLIDAISKDAVFHGDFTLTSGKKASYYIDLRKVSLDGRVAPLIGQVMVDLIADIPNVDAVGGLTMGADPIAAAVLHQGAAQGRPYDAFVVRKEPKDHGRGRQVEGPELAGKRVVVLEDTSTTGGSPLKAIEALLKVAPRSRPSPSSSIATPARRKSSRPPDTRTTPRSDWPISDWRRDRTGRRPDRLGSRLVRRAVRRR